MQDPIFVYDVNTAAFLEEEHDVETWTWKYRSPFDAFEAAMDIYDFIKKNWVVSAMFQAGTITLTVVQASVIFSKIGCMGAYSIQFEEYSNGKPVMVLLES